MQRYEELNKIGEGTYGVVFQARDTLTGDYVALKKIRINSKDEGIPSTAIREIALMKELDHPNIVKLLDVIHTDTFIILVFEHIDQDLHRHLENVDSLDVSTIKSYMYQLLLAVGHCHHYRILHRDLKPQNILITGSGELKLTDFGLARASDVPVKKYTNEVVTLWYRSPEILLGSHAYSTSIDMWSCGCIFAEMYNKSPLFMAPNDEEQCNVIFKKLGTPTTEIMPKLKTYPKWHPNMPEYPGENLQDLVPRMDSLALDLLSKLFVYDPDKRIECREALNHPYFDDVRKGAYRRNSD